MKRMKKCLSLLLSLCLSVYALPSLATVGPTAVKKILSEAALAQAVGGNAEARFMNQYKNTATNSITYTGVVTVSPQGGLCVSGSVWALEFIKPSDGTVTATLASGSVPGCGGTTAVNVSVPDSAAVGIPTPIDVRLRVWNTNVPLLTASTVSRYGY